MKLPYQFRLFREIFFPRRCAVCNTEIDTGLVCDKCREHFIINNIKIYGANCASWKQCVTTGQPLVIEDVIDRVHLIYRYDSVFKDSLHALKFEARAELLPLLKEEAEVALTPLAVNLGKHYDYVISIPTSEERKRKRGFDVPLVIFSSLKQVFRDRYTDNILLRARNTAPLYTMAAADRRNELEGCFELNHGVNVKGKRILLCDDIYTTGSTMLEAAQVLLKAGAKTIGVLTLCASKDNWDC